MKSHYEPAFLHECQPHLRKCSPIRQGGSVDSDPKLKSVYIQLQVSLLKKSRISFSRQQGRKTKWQWKRSPEGSGLCFDATAVNA